MKRILINATHIEEIRVALCKGNHLYDFDLENRTREQKKSNIYKGHVTRVEPSLEAVFVEYGSKKQGFLPVREIASEYLKGNPREENIKKLIKEGDELIVQVEKEERGNKGAALSTYVSLAGRYLVLMPNNPKGGGISRQISGKMRDDMKQMLRNMDMPKGMSVIIRTAGIGKSQEDLQHDLNHLLNIWEAIGEQNRNYPSPRLVHQEAGVVTRAVRDYLRDDITEIWIDNEEAFIEAETFIKAVMPKQIDKLRKYTDYEPMFARFGIEKQIETAYQREVQLPSGGSIVIDQTEALVSIDINSARSTKGADVSETAYHTNLEAADEIARQLRLRDMGGLIVIDFIDMSENKHQKDVEKRLVEATRYDRARVQFGEISRFGLLEMSRQRLRPSLEESTGYICPRCNGNGMIRDLRSLSLSIMRQIEQIALRERHGELQAEVPTDIAAFLLNEKRESLVYLEQDSGTRITILPHAHLESPNFNLHFNHHGFAPSSYERVTDTQQQETNDRGYEVDWQTAETDRPEQQPVRQPRQTDDNARSSQSNSAPKSAPHSNRSENSSGSNKAGSHQQANGQAGKNLGQPTQQAHANGNVEPSTNAKPEALAWLSNLFAPTPQAQVTHQVSSQDAAEAIEAIVNTGASSRGMFGSLSTPVGESSNQTASQPASARQDSSQDSSQEEKRSQHSRGEHRNKDDEDKRGRKHKNNRKYDKRHDKHGRKSHDKHDKSSKRHDDAKSGAKEDNGKSQSLPKREPNSRRDSRGEAKRSDALTASQTEAHRNDAQASDASSRTQNDTKSTKSEHKHSKPDTVNLRVNKAPSELKEQEVVHLSLDNSKPVKPHPAAKNQTQPQKQKQPESEQSSPSSQTASKTSSQPVRSHDDTKQTASNNGDDGLKSGATADFNRQDLFANRYVTAKKYGQASNDPRVVKANMLADGESKVTQEQSPVSNTTTQATGNTITGTVGTFIATVLGDATSNLETEGVIARFLKALEVHQQSHSDNANRGNEAGQQQTGKNGTQSSMAFDFVNYGYEPLSASYLSKFANMTAPVAEVSTEQGKTDVAERPIGERASNDPRGQHPDYVSSKSVSSKSESSKHSDGEESHPQTALSPASTDDDLPKAAEQKQQEEQKEEGIQSDASNDVPETKVETKVETTETETKTTKSGSAMSSSLSPLQAMQELLSLTTGQLIERILGQAGTQMLANGQTEAAFLQALNQPFDVLLSVAKETVAKEAVNDLSGEPQADAMMEHQPNNTQADDTLPASALTSAEHSHEVAHSHQEQLDAATQVKEVDQNEGDNASAPQSESKESEDAQGEQGASSDEQSDEQQSKPTSAETYRSMIENVSEQMSHATLGILNMVAPKPRKAPSSRRRKADDDDDA